MKTEQIVKELEEVARKLGVDVRIERGSFRGGICTIDEDRVIVLNKRQPPEARLAILADSLRALPVDSVFMRPAVRQALEESWNSLSEPQVEESEFE